MSYTGDDLLYIHLHGLQLSPVDLLKSFLFAKSEQIAPLTAHGS